MSGLLDDLDLSVVQDPAARAILDRLLDRVERQAAEIAALRVENQRLRDEVARLKGEQGKPRVLPRRQAKRERRERGAAWCKRAKLADLPIDGEETCRLDPATLPPDAQLKDYVALPVQDVVLRAEAVRFVRERWAAASTGRTSTAPLPAG